MRGKKKDGVNVSSTSQKTQQLHLDLHQTKKLDLHLITKCHKYLKELSATL